MYAEPLARSRRCSYPIKLGTIIAASVALIFSDGPSANPTGAQVVNGAVSIQQPAAGVLNVTNSPGSIIHWQGFSIGASEITRFVQQSASSAVLNRVTGGNVSQIYGQLLSNGRVFLVNPGGIVVGPGAIVDTAGFVGSTLNMLDSDFLAGRLKFQGDSSSGSIINQGWIRTGYGGQVVLVAPSIENSGLIHTPGGELILAAGQKVTVSSLDHEGVQFEVQAPSDSVLNVGKLIADGGAVGVFAGTLKHSGEIRANSLVYDEAGRVILKAQNEIQLAAGSATSADGKTGGTITVQSVAGSTRVAGSVSATGSAGAGGNVELLGKRVAVVENAVVDASGATGGGRILVGGDYQGANPAVQNSSNTLVGSSATLRADATQNGDGGRVVVWSDDKAQFYGSLSAQGGPQGGNGGLAEVSGKRGLVFAGGAMLGAPKGNLGTLLLDPLDLYVFAGGGLDPTIIDESTDFPSNAATVSPATLAAINGNVNLYASRYMRISDPIVLTTAGQALTATVDTYTAPASPDPLALSTIPNRLDVAAGITTAGGAVSLNAPTIQSIGFSPISIATRGGAISLTSSNQILASNLALDAGSGAVTATNMGRFISLGPVTGGTFTANAPAEIVVNGAITTSGGSVNVAAGGEALVGNVVAGSGSVIISSGGGIDARINGTGPVTLTATGPFSSIFAQVNGASSVTATAGGLVSLESSTDLNVANVTAGTNAIAVLSTAGGAIRGTSSSSLVKGLDVWLQTSAGTGGGIGTAGTALNVDVQRNFTLRTNSNFNILLNGTGPIGFDAQFAPASSGAYSGTLSKSGALTLSASADTSTVTVSNLNVTSGFDQQVFFALPSIQISTNNGANLVASSVNVPAGATNSTIPLPNGIPLPVRFISAGNLTVTNYTRAAGGLEKSTLFSSGDGTVNLGNVDASKDTVTVNGPRGITVGSVRSIGNITLDSGLGAVNAASDSVAVEVTSGGTLSITGRGIGTHAFSNPLDLAASAVNLTSSASGPIGGMNPIITTTQSLTVDATSGSTFNISTGGTSLTNLTALANATRVGDAGLAQVITAGGAAVYTFDVNAGAFTFNPPASTGRNVTFTSTSGDINLGAVSLGTGNLVLTSNNASIRTNGNSISAAAVTLNAAGIDTSAGLGLPGDITASAGDLILRGGGAVTTGALNTPGQLTIGCQFCLGAVSVGVIGATGAPAGMVIHGGSITARGSITAAGDVILDAQSGPLTLGGPLMTADGRSVVLASDSILTPLRFTQINAGPTGTVNIGSTGGIEQTADGGNNGITAKTVVLGTLGGGNIPTITNSADAAFSRLDLLGTTELVVTHLGTVKLDAHNSQFTRLEILTTVAPALAPFEIANMGSAATGGVQALSIAAGTQPFELSLNSPTPLIFTLRNETQSDITLVGSGIVTSGGLVSLASGRGIGGNAPISTGGGSVTLRAENPGTVNIAGGITTAGGAVDITGSGISTGSISTGGGAMRLHSGRGIDVSGNLNAGSGTVVLEALNGSISGGSSITANNFTASTAFGGEINLTGAITAPAVTLTAARFGTTANEGLVVATALNGTADLTLSGDLGFNVASNSALSTLSVATKASGTGPLSLAAPGQTYGFNRPATDLFGANVSGTAFEVVAVTAPSANATFTATDGILLVRGATGEPNKIDVQNLTLQAQNGGNIVLQGNAANPLKLSNASQVFSATSLSAGDILIRGKVTLASTGSQTFSADRNIMVNADAGGGVISITAPSQTFTTSGVFSKMEFLGGAAPGEKVTIASTGEQFMQTMSVSADAVRLQGGSGSGSSVTITHSGSGLQTLAANGTLTVAGGSGANAFAKVEETSTNHQRICSPFFSSCLSIIALNILGGSGTGAFAQLISAGSQEIAVGGTTVRGGSGDGAHALVQAATSQTLFGGGVLVEGQGGPGVVGKAEILAGGSQDFRVGAMTVKAGVSNGSVARIAATGSQSIVASGLSVAAQGTESAPLSNASAIIEGADQTIFVGGDITLKGGSGTGSGSTSDAVLRNTAGSQLVSVWPLGTLTLDGGHQFSTTGILNLGSGPQSISAGAGGIIVRSDTAFAGSPRASSVVAIQNQASTLQTIATAGTSLVAAGGLRLSNNGGGTVGVTSAGSQHIDAQFVEVLTGPSTEVGPNSATISAATHQYIFTTNTSASGFPSLRVAALGAGTASVEAGRSQLLELDYPSQMQTTGGEGRLIIGDVNAVGTSRVRALDPLLVTPANQTIFAHSITIQAGTANSTSELKATGAQAISTLHGGIDVLGGSGDNSLAQIDPTLQTILSNGTISVIAGSGVNAIAQITANTGTTPNGQTILVTNGDIELVAGGPSGTSSSGAFITNAGSSSFIGASGEIFLTPGSVSGADAIISVGNGAGTLVTSCGGSLCTLSPAGSTPSGGVLATGFASSGDIFSSILDTTSLTLPLHENVADLLIDIAPASASEPRRIPLCR